MRHSGKESLLECARRPLQTYMMVLAEVQHRKKSRNVLLKIRVIQGHTSGNLIAPELMDHVFLPFW